jgi:hypothetical protein
MNTIAWNTNRTYTEHGQRIAATTLGDGVFFSDQDRGIAAFLPQCALTREAVMQRYDYNDRMEHSLPDDRINRWSLIDQLNSVSEKL